MELLLLFFYQIYFKMIKKVGCIIAIRLLKLCKC